MLTIERVSWRMPRYIVRDGAGHRGVVTRRRFAEAVTGDIDGDPFALQRDGRRHFRLVSSGTVLAAADATKRGRWTISAHGSEYQLRRASRWRSDMELCRGAMPVGLIRKARAPRGRVLCELPAELSPAVQAFVGFVVQALWNRACASGGSAAVVASS